MLPTEITQAKRRRILDAALRVFSEKGFHNATISEVANEAHVGKGTVYLYFDGKESLLVQIFDDLVDLLIEAFDQIALHGARLRDVVARIASRGAGTGKTKEQITRLLAQQPVLSTLALEGRRQSVIERVVARLADRVRMAMDEGVIRPCNPVLAACILLSLPGVVSLYDVAAQSGGTPEALAEAAEDIANLLWEGLGEEGYGTTDG